MPPEGCEGAGPGSVTMLGGYELREAPVTAPPVMMPMMQVTTMMPAPAPTMALYDSSADPIVVPMASPFAFVRRFIELVLEAARSLTRGSRG